MGRLLTLAVREESSLERLAQRRLRLRELDDQEEEEQRSLGEAGGPERGAQQAQGRHQELEREHANEHAGDAAPSTVQADASDQGGGHRGQQQRIVGLRPGAALTQRSEGSRQRGQ